MSSALKPTGVTTSPVSQQMSKSLHGQNSPTTYGQPMSHLPQNLVNLPNSTTPANAHSNKIHSANHYSLNTSTTPQPYMMGGNVPPPSNHPVANVTQPTPPKNSAYNSNTNNVAHSFKLSTPAQPENTSGPIKEVTEIAIERPQSNGTAEEKPSIPLDPQKHDGASTVKDKTPIPLEAGISDSPTSDIENPVEPGIPSATEKPVETQPQIIPVVQSVDIEVEVTPIPSAPDLSEKATTSEIPIVAAPVVVEPVVIPMSPVIATTTSVPVEPSVPMPSTTKAVPLQPEKSPETTAPRVADSVKSPNQTLPSTNVPTPVVTKPKEQIAVKPTLKLATTPRSIAQQLKPIASLCEPPKIPKNEPKEIKLSPATKVPGLVARNKRTRTRTQPYQSPLPEVEMISKISAIASTSKTKNIEDKLIVFYKNEFLAVRNSEGGFYLCQALHNIFKSTRKIRILWLSQDKTDSDIYNPDFYDQTDFDCILTNINLMRVAKGKFKLPDKERIRTDSILKRALAVEKGDATPPCLTEEHPDGLDLSLYKKESQIKKPKGKKRKASPSKSFKTAARAFPEEAKVRKIELKPKLPPVNKSLVLKKTLAVKAKESTVVNLDKIVKAKQVAESISGDTKTSPVIDQKKAKVLAKVVKRSPVVMPSLPSSSNAKPQIPRKQSMKSTDTVVPFLRKEYPHLKKEVSIIKKEVAVLRKEVDVKKDGPAKRETVAKRVEVAKRDISVVRREMPVLKREVPIAKKETSTVKPVLTRKSSRGKK